MCSTYEPEGDLGLALTAFDLISSITNHFDFFLSGTHPSVRAVIRRLATDELNKVDYFLAARLAEVAYIVRPACDYLKSQLEVPYAQSLRILQAASLCSPSRIPDVKEDLQLLHSLRFVEQDAVVKLQECISHSHKMLTPRICLAGGRETLVASQLGRHLLVEFYSFNHLQQLLRRCSPFFRIVSLILKNQ